MKSTDKELLQILKVVYKVIVEKGTTELTYKEFKKQELADIKYGAVTIGGKKMALKGFLYEEDDSPFNRSTNFSGNLFSGNFNKVKIDKRRERQAIIKSLREIGIEKDYTYQELIKYDTKKLQKIFLEKYKLFIGVDGSILNGNEILLGYDNYATEVYRGTGKNRQVLHVCIERYEDQAIATSRWYLVSGDGDMIKESMPMFFNSYFTDQMIIAIVIENTPKD